MTSKKGTVKKVKSATSEEHAPCIKCSATTSAIRPSTGKPRWTRDGKCYKCYLAELKERKKQAKTAEGPSS